MSEELIDVLTADGTPTGLRKTKSEIHRDGDWHRAAHVWIVTPDRRVILQLRSKRKANYPGLWDVSSAGHVSAGEAVLDAAIRETAEEIGIDISAGELTPIGTFPEQSVLCGGTYLDNEINEVFLVRKAVGESDVKLQPEEVDAVAFVPIEELWQRIENDPRLVPHREEYELLLRVLTEIARS
jgi:isopentenyl-diphosphate Delta-isomerase